MLRGWNKTKKVIAVLTKENHENLGSPRTAHSKHQQFYSIVSFKLRINFKILEKDNNELRYGESLYLKYILLTKSEF